MYKVNNLPRQHNQSVHLTVKSVFLMNWFSWD